MRTQEEIDKILDRVVGLLGDFDKADDAFKRKQWKEHYTEKLGPYEAKMKALNGDDFDLYGASYDEFSKDFSDIDADEYVTELVKNIDALLDKLRNAIGEDKVELESGPEGTEVVSHEDKGIEANIEDEPAEKPEEDEMTSDGRAKKMAGWKSPSKSGGRDGHSGLPGTYTKNVTSDEEAKEEPEDEAKDPKAKIVEEAIVKPLTEEPGEEPKETDELEEFIKDLEKYPRAK